MKRYIEPPIGGKAYLYSNSAESSVSLRFVATLTMHLREEFLKQALEAFGIYASEQFVSSRLSTRLYADFHIWRSESKKLTKKLFSSSRTFR